MDSTYRAELKEFNELNFARFDAKIEQRIEVLRAQLERRIDAAKFELIKWMFVFWTGAVLAGRLLR